MYATFVVPAPEGCNLRCPGCAIAQRGEANRVLFDKDYVWFLRDILTYLKVSRVGIQGHEPLLPDSWPTTYKLLRLSALGFVETSLITNGTYLPKHKRELSQLLDSITISLNSASPEIHDKTRGVKGAFKQALEGIYSAVKTFPSGAVTVNSVLYPDKARWLEEMAELLARVGIKKWLISPFFDFKLGRPASSPQFIKDTILYFAPRAENYGVKVLLSDELGNLGKDKDPFEQLNTEMLEKNARFFRLSPDGSCSRGKEALKTASCAPKWNRIEQPSLFLERIFAEINQPLGRSYFPCLKKKLLSL